MEDNDFSATAFYALVGNGWNSSLFCLLSSYLTRYIAVIHILSVYAFSELTKSVIHIVIIHDGAFDIHLLVLSSGK